MLDDRFDEPQVDLIFAGGFVDSCYDFSASLHNSERNSFRICKRCYIRSDINKQWSFDIGNRI
ncbi:MAG TPA: hypothetical protein DCM45_07710 [Clostridiales bacterium]|nr:hypothetical protein [Clostridiales bacterium]